MKHQRILAAFSVVALVVLAGCGGQAGDGSSADDALEVDDSTTSAALTTGEVAGGGGGGGASAGDCQDGDHQDHAHHRRHKFKILDRLDGTKDHQITLASLPADLPARLVARLHELDVDGNGIVTKAEAKALGHKEHGDRGPKGHERDHDDDDGDGQHEHEHQGD